jgi:hypothetical protein
MDVTGQPDNSAAAMNDERPSKRCPECAESVLAAARKCRFCGYRFGATTGVSPDTSIRGLVRRLRRPIPSTTLAGQLAEVGVDLQANERPVGMWLGQVDRGDGYVMVTDSRLFFVRSSRRSGDSRPPQQRWLAEIGSVKVRRKLLRRSLVIGWLESPDTTIRLLSRKDLPEIHRILLNLMPPDRNPNG